jgi:hypothetical protein
MSTSTLFVDLQRLHAQGESGSIVVRLMMAANALALANQCLKREDEDRRPIRSHVIRGAKMYFINLQCGHLHEGLKIIEEIRNKKDLRAELDSCSEFAKTAFNELVECLNGGSKCDAFLQYIELVRHKVAFHYDPKLTSKALERLVSRTTTSTITSGSDISLWRFVVADDVNDVLVCRYIWRIPDDRNVQEEANLIAAQGGEWAKAFLDFAGDFIFRFVQRHAVK